MQMNEWLGSDNREMIALCQEPAQHRGRITNFNRKISVIVGTKTPEEKPRACILYKRNASFHKLAQFCNRDQVAIMLKDGQGKKIIITSTYMPFDSMEAPPPELTKKLIEHCEANRIELIINTDCNSHNEAWGSTDNNHRGDALLDYLMTTNMHICNIGNRPTFKNVIREEVLDITLASTGIMDKIENWKVSEEETFSDHNLIEYELNLTQQSQTEEFRNVKKTRWSQYQHELTKKVEEKKISETEELDEMVEKVNEAIIEAYHKSNKPRKKKQGDLKPPWWSNDLDSLKARVKRCDKKYRRTKQEEDRIARNRAANEYRSAFEKAKKKAWREYCSGIGKTDEASRIVKIMKNGRRADISTIQRKNGTFTGNQIETLQELTNTLFPECQREEKQISESNIQLIEENEELSPDTAEEIVNTARITAAIKMFKPYKSPGKDGIYPILLQRGLEILTPHLARIYRTSITSGRPPKQWLITRAVFIPHVQT